MNELTRQAEPAVAKLLNAEDDQLYEQLGIRSRGMAIDPATAGSFDSSVTYDAAHMGLKDDLKEFGKRLFQRWNKEAHQLACGGDADSKDREDLAKAALVEKAAVITTVELLDSEMLKLDETLDKLSHEIDLLQSKLNDARARQKTIVMRTTATQSRVDVNRQLHNFNIDNAMNKFEYYEKKIDLMEGQVESMTRESKGLHSEFEELARQEKIDLELQAIKSKLNK